MSAPRDYSSFVNLLSVLVPIDATILRSDRSVGGYFALRVAADQYLHNGELALDLDFYRDENAEGGVSTRLMDEPASNIAKAWMVGAHIKATVERYLVNGALDIERVRTAIAHDELLRVEHGQKIILDRASLNAFALMRGQIPSRKLDINGPDQELGLTVLGAGR